MKVLVPVKRVVDYNVKVRVKSDGTGVDTANAQLRDHEIRILQGRFPLQGLGHVDG